MSLRRTTAGRLVFSGLVLYTIELSILLACIPGDIQLELLRRFRQTQRQNGGFKMKPRFS